MLGQHVLFRKCQYGFFYQLQMQTDFSIFEAMHSNVIVSNISTRHLKIMLLRDMIFYGMWLIGASTLPITQNDIPTLHFQSKKFVFTFPYSYYYYMLDNWSKMIEAFNIRHSSAAYNECKTQSRLFQLYPTYSTLVTFKPGSCYNGLVGYSLVAIRRQGSINWHTSFI